MDDTTSGYGSAMDLVLVVVILLILFALFGGFLWNYWAFIALLVVGALLVVAYARRGA